MRRLRCVHASARRADSSSQRNNTSEMIARLSTAGGLELAAASEVTLAALAAALSAAACLAGVGGERWHELKQQPRLARSVACDSSGASLKALA